MDVKYRLTDLANASGASYAQIRRWIYGGAVPRAIGRGPATYYTRTHLEAIRQVMALYEGNLTLADIRDRLVQPPDDH